MVVYVLPTMNVSLNLLKCSVSFNDKHLKTEWLIIALHRSCLLFNSFLDKKAQSETVKRIHVCTTPNLSCVKRRTKKSTKRPTWEEQRRVSHTASWCVTGTALKSTDFPHCIHGARTPAAHAHLRYQPAVGGWAFVSHSGSAEALLQPCPTAH